MTMPFNDIVPALVTVLSSSVVAALVSIVANVWSIRRKSREDNWDRVRTTCAKALAACQEYQEWPYAIRRRNPKRPEDERLRLSEAIRITQQHLHFYTAWMRLENPRLGDAYNALVNKTREIAGKQMKEAWTIEGVTSDKAMSLPKSQVDLSSIEPCERKFVNEVHCYLKKLARWKVGKHGHRDSDKGQPV